jgi:hypothetical protein
MNNKEIENRIEEIYKILDSMNEINEDFLSEEEWLLKEKNYLGLNEELLSLIKLEFPELF